MTLGDRLKRVRMNLHISAASMAESLGINRGTLIKYENNERVPGADLLTVFMKTYNVDPKWLFFGEDSEPSVNNTEPFNIRKIYPGISQDPTVDELIECLQVPVIYHALIYKFIVLRKRYESLIKEYFEKENEVKDVAD